MKATPAAQSIGAGLDWLLVVLVSVLAGCVAVIGFAFLPWHLGPIPVPISALLGVLAMIAAPRACYALTGSMLAALLPVLAWFGVAVWITLSTNSLMPTVSLTVMNGQWRVMVLLGLGALSAAATIGLIWGDRLRDAIAGNKPDVAGGSDDAAGKVTAGPGSSEFI
jgi:hypothetical protein